MDHQVANELPPHVLIFPYPAQGHVQSMLKLAELLCHGGIHVTFLVTHHIHRRLLLHSGVQSRFARYSGFRFQTISNGIPEDHVRFVNIAMELVYSFRAAAKPHLREVLISDRRKNSDTVQRPITCVISDMVMLTSAMDVTEEIGIPIICYYTASPSDYWACSCVPKLIEAGELPFIGNNLDVPIANVPGMEGFLRRRDLPSYCRIGDFTNKDFQIVLNETLKIQRAHALILNTFEELQGPVLAQIRTQCPKLYTIGPVHQHSNSRLTLQNSSNSLWEEDRSCMAWLDAQPLRSVIYVSFGSVTMVTKDQLLEFYHGLINSGKRFLWVIRPHSVADEDGKEVLGGARGKGCIVEWAPQEEVLGHKAIGGFLTHSGWNSTLESIAAGVPMVCWPYLGDQYIISRFVGEVWKLGLDMKDTCDRVVIEKMVRDLMDSRKEEFMQSASQMAKLAENATTEGGSSYCNLDRLIEDIRSMCGDL